MSKTKNKDRLQEFKLPDRKQPVFKFFSKILFGPLYRSKLESQIENLPDKAIIVSIHAAKKGPIAISMTYPKFAAMWGHHGMLGNYRERFSYLRNVLYIQKMHKNKFVATLKALYEAVFSIFIYKGMKIIGTYTDMRLLSTIRNSMGVLDEGASVIIYPEDSSEGYFDEMRSAFPGFVMLAETYYNKKVKTIKTIGFCAGSGSEFISSTPCDAFVTGDLKYHTAVESDKVIYDIGHFESEIMSVELLKELSGVNEKGIIAYEESPFS